MRCRTGQVSHVAPREPAILRQAELSLWPAHAVSFDQATAEGLTHALGAGSESFRHHGTTVTFGQPAIGAAAAARASRLTPAWRAESIETTPTVSPWMLGGRPGPPTR